jgi:hypothetical protein
MLNDLMVINFLNLTVGRLPPLDRKKVIGRVYLSSLQCQKKIMILIY